MFPENLTPQGISAILVLTTLLSLAAFVCGDEKTIQCYCQKETKVRFGKSSECKDGKTECPADDSVVKGHCFKQIYKVESPPEKAGTYVKKDCGSAELEAKCSDPVPIQGADNMTGTSQWCNCKGNLCNASTRIISTSMTAWIISFAGLALIFI